MHYLFNTSMLVVALVASGSRIQGQGESKGLPIYGPSCGATLSATKTSMHGKHRFDLHVEGAYANAPLAFVFGVDETRSPLPLNPCTLLTTPIVHVPAFTNGDGRAHGSIVVPDLGTAAYCQALPINLFANEVSASNGVQLFGDEARVGPSACPPNKCTASEMIIGCDNRIRGPLTGTAASSPWNMVGSVIRNGGPSGTGTLISAKYVLTAAHVVYDNNGFKGGTIGFRLGLSGNGCTQRPFGTHYVKRVFVPRDYVHSASASNKALDYCILELANPILGGHVMQASYLSWATVQNMQTTAVGYPGDKPWGSCWYDRGYLADSQPWAWQNSGEKGLLRCSNDGVGGMSGGPLYVWHNGVRKLIGVFIGSPENECLNGHVWAARMTPNAITHINNAKFFPPNGNVIDFFWRWNSPPLQADVPGGC